MKYCSFCGRQIEDEFCVCPYCGKGSGGINSPGSPAQNFDGYNSDAGTTEMIFGIAALVIPFLIPILSIVSLVFAILAISRRNKLVNRGINNAKLTAALVCSIIGICVSVIYMLVILFTFAILGQMLSFM